MSTEPTAESVKGSYGDGFVIMGNDKIEVSPDGKKVTAYTDDGVELKSGEAAATQGISISADFNTVVLKGVTIERAADGHLVISAPSGTTLYKKPANDTPAATKKELQVGDKMEDGTVFAGISPDTNAPMYATPADAPLTMKWKDAMKYAAGFEGHGKPKGTFRVPTSGELNVLFQNRAKIGGFNETGSSPAGWYWSSTEGGDFSAHGQRFSDGYRGWYGKVLHSSVRLVRS